MKQPISFTIVLFLVSTSYKSVLSDVDVNVTMVTNSSATIKISDSTNSSIDFVCNIEYHPLTNTTNSVNINNIIKTNATFSLENLLNLTNYEMKSNCSVNNSIIITLTNWTTLPTYPNDISLVNPCTNVSCNISWTETIPQDLISQYVISITEIFGEKIEKLINISSAPPPVSLFSLTPATNYSIKIKVQSNLNVESDWSDSFNISTFDNIPSKPEDVTIDELDSLSVIVEWSPPDPPIYSLYSLKYIVTINVDNKPIQTVEIVNSTSAEFDGLPTCTQLYATVAASNRAGVSEPANSLTHYTRPGIAQPVTNVVVSESYSLSQLVTWSIINNVYPCPVEYVVETILCEDNSIVNRQRVQTEQYNSTGLDLATQYKYTIYSIVGNSTYGQASSATVTSSCVYTSDDIPTEPLNVTIDNITSTHLYIKWNVPENSNTTIDGSLNYIVQWFNHDDSGEITTNETVAVINGSWLCADIIVRVKATNSAGSGSWSENSTSFTIAPNVNGVTIVNSTSSTQFVAWNDIHVPLCPHKFNVFTFFACDSTSMVYDSRITTNPYYYSTGLHSYQTYSYMVSSVVGDEQMNVLKLGTLSEPSSCVPTKENIPTEPLNVTIINITNSQLFIKWNEPERKNSNSSISYKVNLKIHTKTMEIITTETEANFSNLWSCASVAVRVQAINNIGSGPWSLLVKNQTSMAEIPIVSIPLISNSTNTTQTINWNNTEVALCPYHFIIKQTNCNATTTTTTINNSVTWLTQITNNFVTFNDLLPYRWYQYEVLPVVNSTNGSWSPLSDCSRTNPGNPPIIFDQNQIISEDKNLSESYKQQPVIDNEKQIVVGLPLDAFSSDYGPILYYLLLVATMDFGDYDEIRNPPSANGPYPIFIQGNAQNVSNQQSFAFVVGESSNCTINFTGNCNLFLQPDTEYKFKLRAYTAGGYSSITLLSRSTEPLYEIAGLAWIVILSLSGFLAIVCIVIVITMVYSQRKKKISSEKSEKGRMRRRTLSCSELE